MKILFITSQLPYPPYSGGVIKSYRLLKYLSQHLTVSLLCNLKGDDPKHEEDLKRDVVLREYHSVEVNRSRSIKGLLSSHLQSKTLNEWRNHSREMELLVKDLWKHNDLILIDHYEMFQFVPLDCNIPVVLHTHNAEHIMWSRFAELDENMLKRKLLQWEASRIKKAEQKACKESKLVLAAPEDARALLQGLEDMEVPITADTLHLGNQELLHLPALQFDKAQKALLFFGSLGWQANADALEWFMEKVWPLVRLKEPHAVFYIVGKNPPIHLRKLAKKHGRIVFTGFVENLDTYFQKCRVFVNPIRFGSGVKVKMLDAMYRGIPTISSAMGTESLSMTLGQHFLQAEKPEEWVQAISILLNDMTTWNKLSINARALASNEYRWEPMLKNHLKDIRNCISQPKAHTHAI